MKNQTFGTLARKITIEIDDKGVQRVNAVDHMIVTPNGTMIALPKPQLTDSRLLALQLITVAHTFTQAIFAAMQAPKNLREVVNAEAPHNPD